MLYLNKMKKFFLILCVLTTSCIANVSDYDNDINDDIIENNDNISKYPKFDNDYYDPCLNPEIKILEYSDEKVFYIEIPTLCLKFWYNFNDSFQTDPIEEQLIDPNEKTIIYFQE